MALTSFGPNHPLAVKHWARRLFRETIKETFFSRFTGRDSRSIVQIRTETQKEAGDKITFGLRVRLKGKGVTGDATMEGNEEKLSTYNDSVTIDQLRHAVRSAGRMSEQRVPFSVREEARSGLTDWWAERLDTCFFNQLAGNSLETDLRYTGNQVAPEPTHRLIAGGRADEAALTTADTFMLRHIDYLVEMAKTIEPSMRPVRVGGQDMWVLFLHPYQVTDLALEAGETSWSQIQKAVIQGGSRDSGLFNGALGVYKNVILHESHRLPQGNNGTAYVNNTRRAVFCGAQAAAMAFGQGDDLNSMNWVEERFDYQNQLGVSAGMIFGLKKTQFNGADFATIVLSTYARTHT